MGEVERVEAENNIADARVLLIRARRAQGLREYESATAASLAASAYASVAAALALVEMADSMREMQAALAALAEEAMNRRG